MELIELEKALDIAREYLYKLEHNANIDELTLEIENEMRNNTYNVDTEDDYWNYDKATDEQIKFIRKLIYHDYEEITKGDASRIIDIILQSKEEK